MLSKLKHNKERSLSFAGQKTDRKILPRVGNTGAKKRERVYPRDFPRVGNGTECDRQFFLSIWRLRICSVPYMGGGGGGGLIPFDLSFVGT